jgi:hypothetical protein
MRKYLRSSLLKSPGLKGNLTDSSVSDIFNPNFPRVRSPAREKSRCQFPRRWPFFSLSLMTKSYLAAPAIPFAELWDASSEIVLLRQRSFLFSRMQNCAQLRAHEICSGVNWAGTEFRTEISSGLFMCAFNWSRCVIRSALANGLNPPKSRGRHLAVDAGSDANLLAWIQRQTENNAAVTRTDIKNYGAKCASLKSRGDGWTRSSHIIPPNWPKRKVLHKKSRICKFRKCSWKKGCAVCMKHSRAVQ